MAKKVVCRRCKEDNSSWEIRKPDGTVDETHYSTKRECVKAGRKMQEEYGCMLEIEDKK